MPRALLSVYDKTGIVELANALRECDVEILSTGGTAKTLAAAGIGGFSSILGVVREKAPLRRAIETSEVGDAAAFLLSDAGRGVTGEVMLVDAGYHVLGM